jgi:hypothetical protein
VERPAVELQLLVLLVRKTAAAKLAILLVEMVEELGECRAALSASGKLVLGRGPGLFGGGGHLASLRP